MEIKIKPVHTLKDLIFSALVVAAGIGLFFVATGWGILFCLIGVLMFVFYKGAYKRVGESTRLSQKTVDLSPDYRQSVVDFLEGKDVDPEIVVFCDGDHLYLDVYFNSDMTLAYAKLFDVSNNNFEPVIGFVELHGEKAKKLVGKL